MARLYIRCYGELNDYLPDVVRQRRVIHHMKTPCSILDVMQHIGVPVDKIDLLLCNGQPAGFDDRVETNDRISVYPQFLSIDITPLHLINRGYSI